MDTKEASEQAELLKRNLMRAYPMHMALKMKFADAQQAIDAYTLALVGPKGRQGDLVKDFGFPPMPKCPCLSCNEYEHCRKSGAFMECDEYKQWRKERGFNPL